MGNTSCPAPHVPATRPAPRVRIKTIPRLVTAIAVVLAVVFVDAPAPMVAGSDGGGHVVESISSNEISPGDVVEIVANGLGARNVAVTVDRIDAEILGATGARVTFVVPDGISYGVVPVTVTNPGGISASIEVTVPWDGSTGIELSRTSASDTIGPDGGSIEVGGLTLEVPPNGLREPTEITVTPIMAASASPFADGFVTGALLEPDGLQFWRHARLRFDDPGAPAIGGHGTSDGDDMALAPVFGDGTDAFVPLTHFSSVVVTTNTAETIAAARREVYDEAATWIRHLLDIAALRFAGDQTTFDREVDGLLLRWANELEAMIDAVTETASLQVALRQYALFFEAISVSDRNSTIDPRRLEIEELLVDRSAAITRSLLAGCDGTDPVGQVAPLIPLSIELGVAGIDLSKYPADPGDPTGRVLPELPMEACVTVEMTGLSYPDHFVPGLAHPVTVRAGLDPWNGELRHDVPLRFELVEPVDGPEGEAVYTVTQSETNDVGRWDLEVNVPDDVVTQWTFGVTIRSADPALEVLGLQAGTVRSVPVVDRVSLMPAEGADTIVDPGASIDVVAQLYGPDISGQTVDASLVAAGGSISPRTVTTDEVGQARFTFTAGPDAGDALIRVTNVVAGVEFSDELTVGVNAPAIVTVTPAQQTLVPGQQVDFDALVEGDVSSDSVVWSATGGQIDQDGLYTAGSTGGQFTVTATSAEDPDAVGVATVDIVVEEVDAIGTWEGFVYENGVPTRVPMTVVVREWAPRLRIDATIGSISRTYYGDVGGGVLSADGSAFLGPITFEASIAGDVMTGYAGLGLYHQAEDGFLAEFRVTRTE